MPRRRTAPNARKSVAIIGLGNIGSFAAQLIARMPEVCRVIVVDKDRYSPANLAGQDIRARDGHAALPKAAVTRRRLRAIRPDLEVVAVHDAVENVPRGLLRTDVILACLDSKRARMAVNEVACRLGVPWIDAGVQADGLLARVNVYRPGGDQPCLECAWDERSYTEIEQRLPCLAAGEQVPSTNAPACLGSLAGSLQAIQCGHLLAGRVAQLAAGRQLVMDAASRRFYDTALRRNPGCRFDHETWRLRELRASVRSLSLADAFRAGTGVTTVDRECELAIEPKSFVRSLACVCGFRRELLRLSDRIPSLHLACPQCGQPMQPLGFAMFPRLAARDLTPRELRQPLASLGFRPGDIFSVSRGDKVVHCQLPVE